jgi:cation transport ATPase
MGRDYPNLKVGKQEDEPKLNTVKLWRIFRTYPVPALALIGLTLGGLFYLGFDRPDIARWVWYFTLIVGGLPLVWETFKGMLRGRFASDIVAMLAIIAAILLDQAFAGVIVVLMQSGGEAIEKYGLR